MQIDNQHATGTVNVAIDERGQASYHFAENTAWDHLSWNDSLASLSAKCDAVCFGSLAQRSPRSCDVIHRFLSGTRPSCLRIFDVNLRQAFYTRQVIEASLQTATILKLNDDELPIIVRLLDAPGLAMAETLRWLSDRYSLHLIALTCGSRASVLYSNGIYDEKIPPTVKVVDTVGAGDAFTAALAVGLLKQVPIEEIHRAASEIAAYVCTQSGATPRLPVLRLNGC